MIMFVWVFERGMYCMVCGLIGWGVGYFGFGWVGFCVDWVLLYFDCFVFIGGFVVITLGCSILVSFNLFDLLMVDELRFVRGVCK